MLAIAFVLYKNLSILLYSPIKSDMNNNHVNNINLKIIIKLN